LLLTVHTHRHFWENTFLDVLKGLDAESVEISKSIFCTMTILPWDMEVKFKPGGSRSRR